MRPNNSKTIYIDSIRNGVLSIVLQYFRKFTPNRFLTGARNTLTVRWRGLWTHNVTYSWSICSLLFAGGAGNAEPVAADAATRGLDTSGSRYVWNEASTKCPSPSTFDKVSQMTLDSLRKPWSVARTNSSDCQTMPAHHHYWLLVTYSPGTHTGPLSLQAGCSSWRPTNSVKAYFELCLLP